MNDELLNGSVFKSLMLFAIPFMLSNLLQVLYGAADLFVVGHFATTSDVSAVSIGSQTMAMLTNLILGFTTGITVLLGQFFGAKKEKELAATVGSSVVLFTMIAVTISIILFLTNHQIVGLMHTPNDAISATRSYLYICSLGTVFIVGYNAVSAILRGLGDSKTPLLFIAIACVINVIVDFILVDSYQMGAAGAAIATVLAQAGAFIFSLIYLKYKGLGFKFNRQDISFNLPMIAKITKVGLPIGLQSALVGISFLLITVIVNGMGLVASASVGVVEKLIEFLMLPAIALGNAVATMTAQNFGAEQYSRAYKSMRYGIAFCLSISLIVTIVCQFDGSIFTRIFSSDQAVIKNAALYLQTYSFDCLCTSFIFCYNGYLNGGGYTVFTMLHSLLATFILRIPLTLVISKLSGITLFHMGIASPIASMASIIMCVIYIRYLNKKLLF